jgi:glyoxylase-like metal-dependent hydrolase (beta-lactamase superfamily II)
MFRQLFDSDSSTYTYLIGDEAGGEAVIVDPVRERVERDLGVLAASGLRLAWVLETHVHADHVTGARALRERTGARTAVSLHCGATGFDRLLTDGDEIALGGEHIRAIATPGHTPGSTCYLWRDRLLTGDTLLIGGCGRTDFQNGDAGALYDSITGKLFTLPKDTLVYPGHDYKGRRVSTIGEERAGNARLAGRSREAFIEIMANLGLPEPKRIHEAVPANLRGGTP